MSQSTVSERLRSLEEALTVSLFHRSSEGVVPTHAGKFFFDQAREALRVLDIATSNAASISQGMAGQLTLGLYTSLSTGRLRDAVSAFRADHPEIDLRVIEGARTQMIEGLNSRSIDMTVLIGEANKDLGEAMPFWREQVHVAVPIDHRFASLAAITWQDLEGETLLVSTHGAGAEAEGLLSARLSGGARRPTVQSHFISRETVVSMVGMGFGLSLLIDSDLGRGAEGVVVLPLAGPVEDTHVPLTAYRDPGNDNPPLRRFWSMLKAQVDSTS